MEEQAAAEGPIPPLMSSSGRQKAGEDGRLSCCAQLDLILISVLKRRRKGWWGEGGGGAVYPPLSAQSDNPRALDSSTWVNAG